MVEVAIALGLILIVLVPLAGVYYAGETTGAHNREYGDAINIANGELSQAAGVTYADLGFYASQSPASQYNGQPTVMLGAAPPTGTSAQVQTTANPVTVGAISYSVANYIVWATGSGSKTCAYKQVYSVVSWNEGGTQAHVTQSVLVYPGGLGKYSAAECASVSAVSATSGSTSLTVSSGGFGSCVVGMYVAGSNIPGGATVTGVSGNTLTLSSAATGTGTGTITCTNVSSGSSVTPDNVDGLAASVPADPQGETQVVLTWNPPLDTPGSYVAVWATSQSNLDTPDDTGTDASWAPSGSSTSTSGILGTATTYTVQGLAPSTTYWFEIVAFSSNGSHWAVSQTEVSATTLTPPAQPCALGTLTVSQAGQSAGNATVAKSNGHLIQALTMTVSYSGTCTAAADTVTVAATSGGSADAGSPYTLTWGSNLYSYNPPTGLCTGSYITGTHTYSVSLNGTVVTGTSAVVTFSQDKHSTPSC